VERPQLALERAIQVLLLTVTNLIVLSFKMYYYFRRGGVLSVNKYGGLPF
jgi:hypothetical protein